MFMTTFCTMSARARWIRWEKFGGEDQGGVTRCEMTFICLSKQMESNCSGCSAHLFCAEALVTAGDAVVLCACCCESHKPLFYARLDPRDFL